MKYFICLFVAATCVANSWGQDSLPPPPPPPSELNALLYESQHPFKRIARQSMPEPLPPPDADQMTPPPDMPQFQYQSISRERREARGVGGSMPTRKG